MLTNHAGHQKLLLVVFFAFCFFLVIASSREDSKGAGGIWAGRARWRRCWRSRNVRERSRRRRGLLFNPSLLFGEQAEGAVVSLTHEQGSSRVRVSASEREPLAWRIDPLALDTGGAATGVDELNASQRGNGRATLHQRRLERRSLARCRRRGSRC